MSWLSTPPPTAVATPSRETETGTPHFWSLGPLGIDTRHRTSVQRGDDGLMAGRADRIGLERTSQLGLAVTGT